MPAVVSSTTYIQYLQKKQKEKEYKEQKKNENIRKTKEKQEENQIRKSAKAKKTQDTIKRKKVVQKSDTSDDETDWVESGSSTLDVSYEALDEEYIRSQDPLSDCEDPINVSPPENEKSLQINDFAVIKFRTKKKSKYFVGKIIHKFGDEGYEVAFIKYDEHGKFKWPIVEDKSFIY